MSTTLDQLRKELNYEKTNNCVQCGYCLPVCPTYATMGKETHSPRGRINLIKMVGEGRIKDLSVIEEPFNLCLGCRACETVCPTGVEYGAILESAKEAIVKRKKFPTPIRMLRGSLLRQVIPSRKWMNFTGNAYWLYEKTGIQKIAQKSGVMKKLPYNLGKFEAITPSSVSPVERGHFPTRVEAKGEKKYTVAFFTGCIMDALFQKINRLSVQLLAEVGCEVIVIPNQTCCGALHSHAGEVEEARNLAKQNITAFEKEKVDFIINNAGGCGAMLNEYHKLLANEPEWADKAFQFSQRTKDISQILVMCGGISNLSSDQPERVTYQPSCHMTNVQKVTNEPLQLLNSIKGIEFIRMQQENMCCGSAGIYNIVNYNESMKVLDMKMENVKDTDSAVIITTNPGCLLQMKLGIERENLTGTVRALHLIEYLAEKAGIS